MVRTVPLSTKVKSVSRCMNARCFGMKTFTTRVTGVSRKRNSARRSAPRSLVRCEMPTSTVSESATRTSPPSMCTSGSSARPSYAGTPFRPGCNLNIAFSNLDSICRMGKKGRAMTTQPPGTAKMGSRMKKRFMSGGLSNSRGRLEKPETRWSMLSSRREWLLTNSSPQTEANISRFASSPCWLISVRRSFTCTTWAPRERKRFVNVRCCAFRSTRLKHSSTFIVSSVQGMTASTSKPGSCTITSSNLPCSLARAQAACREGGSGSFASAGKSSAIMQRTEPPPRRSIVGTGTATTLSTQDSMTSRCASSSADHPASEMANTVPRAPLSWMQLHAKLPICSRVTPTTTLCASFKAARTARRSCSSGIASEQSTAKLWPTDRRTLVW
mmetsp:Transcript_86309/g.267245  ORF Transcript_86309/g.267245 Transcript_86309/m.267245 type:complete len:386 (+) Transcript_86309:131-1288(+)